ncbi:hypothetical protein [Shouchella clausii]|uniref:hypothetical protein n=1 Tax=Shouchella clausii TaxID=79880 RepID=UPI001C7339A4|nr:hypothetical protein [Shouchella clausii]MBX0320100.1 hypothetical protein [Shouchella clausii]MEB5480891.1 hypothetical protein [Shouchella clausii]
MKKVLLTAFTILTLLTPSLLLSTESKAEGITQPGVTSVETTTTGITQPGVKAPTGITQPGI